MFHRMVDIPPESRATTCRGYVSCGRCGVTKWNPRDHELAWNALEVPGGGPNILSIADDRLKALIPVFDIYRGIEVPNVYVRRAQATGPIVGYSTFKSCLCDVYTDKELQEFLALGPPGAKSFAMPEKMANLKPHEARYLSMGRIHYKEH